MDKLEKKIKDSYELPNNVIESTPKPLVTVRTSTYQHKPYIKQCIEGVLMQKTSFPIEYIIGEDFSTDGTRKIVFEYAKKYPNIIRVVTANYNVGGRVNGKRCSIRSRGKYIALCEGDDYWTDPYKLEKQINEMKKYPNCNISFHPALIKDKNNKIIKTLSNFGKKNKIFNTGDAIIGGGSFCPTASIIFKNNKNELNKLKYKSPIGDYSLQIFHSINGGLLYIPETMSVYRHELPGSWTEKFKDYNFHKDHFKKINLFLNDLNLYLNYKYNKEIKARTVLNNYHVYKNLKNEVNKNIIKEIKPNNSIFIKSLLIRLVNKIKTKL